MASKPLPLSVFDRKAGRLIEEFMDDAPSTYESAPRRSLNQWLESHPLYDWLALDGPLCPTPRLTRFARSLEVPKGAPLGAHVRRLGAGIAGASVAYWLAPHAGYGPAVEFPPRRCLVRIASDSHPLTEGH